MTPLIATLLYSAIIVALFALSRNPRARTSRVLWLPVLWMAICASRTVAQWIWGLSSDDVGSSVSSPDQYLDGNPFDRVIFAVLVVFALGVLVSRRRKVVPLLRRNGPILLFFLYCAVSTLWSDYPDVAFKRWIKDLGDLAMMLIVLTDINPGEAVKRFLTRVGFVLVPVSILLIKYYPDVGRGYNHFTWTQFWRGVATGKNEFGMLLLVFGLGAVWCGLQIWRDAHAPRRTQRLIAYGAFLAVVTWLLSIIGSMTSLSCFLMGSVLMLATYMRALGRRRWLVHGLVAGMLVLAFSVTFLGASGLLSSMGRDETLTGRTDIWKLVLSMYQNPLVGTGFESFWLGPRIEKIWSIYWWHPNEAHNGYIEVFLNLGVIGLILLAVLLVTGYRNVIRALRRDPREGGLRLAFLFTAVVYNFTESAIRMMQPIWLILLLAIVVVPGGWFPVRKKAVAMLQKDPEGVPCLEAV